MCVCKRLDISVSSSIIIIKSNYLLALEKELIKHEGLLCMWPGFDPQHSMVLPGVIPAHQSINGTGALPSMPPPNQYTSLTLIISASGTTVSPSTWAEPPPRPACTPASHSVWL